MMQSRLFLHSDIDDKLLYVRPKNDYKNTDGMERGKPIKNQKPILNLCVQEK